MTLSNESPQIKPPSVILQFKGTLSISLIKIFSFVERILQSTSERRNQMHYRRSQWYGGMRS